MQLSCVVQPTPLVCVDSEVVGFDSEQQRRWQRLFINTNFVFINELILNTLLTYKFQIELQMKCRIYK